LAIKYIAVCSLDIYIIMMLCYVVFDVALAFLWVSKPKILVLVSVLNWAYSVLNPSLFNNRPIVG